MPTPVGKGRGPAILRDTCLVCDTFRITPAAPPVDRWGVSSDEADSLCRVHRARMTEGYCVLCGRSAPWMAYHDGSAIGWCRRCFVSSRGEKAAQKAERSWSG